MRRLMCAGALATLLAACQAPAPAPGGAFQVDALATGTLATGGARLSVRVALARRLLATTADVSRVSVLVQDRTAAEHVQTLAAADFTAGEAVAGWPDLPAGPASVTIRAYAADDREIGMTRGQMDLRAGLVNELALRCTLATNLPSPGTHGSGEVGITILDGPVLADAPPRPVPVFTPSAVGFSAAGGYVGSLVVDRAGATWWGRRRVLPDGTLQDLGEGTITAAVMSNQGLVWCHRNAKLQLLNGQAQVLRELAAPWSITMDGLAIDAADNLWIAAGKQLRKVSSAGVALGTWDLGGEGGAIAVHKPSGQVWVALRKAGRVERFDGAGTKLGSTAVNQLGDTLEDLALDSRGHAWVAQVHTNRLTQLRPDGTIAGIHAGPRWVARVLVGPDDRIFAAPYFKDGEYDNQTTIWELDPSGERVAEHWTGPISDWAFDAAGKLVLAGGGLARFTL